MGGKINVVYFCAFYAFVLLIVFYASLYPILCTLFSASHSILLVHCGSFIAAPSIHSILLIIRNLVICLWFNANFHFIIHISSNAYHFIYLSYASYQMHLIKCILLCASNFMYPILYNSLCPISTIV